MGVGSLGDAEGYSCRLRGGGSWVICDRYSEIQSDHPSFAADDYSAARDYADALNDDVIARRFGLPGRVMGGQVPRGVVRGEGGPPRGAHGPERPVSPAVGPHVGASPVHRANAGPRSAARPAPVAIPYDEALARLDLF